MNDFDAVDFAMMPAWAKKAPKITRLLKSPGILNDTEPKRIQVLDEKTGKAFWLPRRLTVFVPGGVQLPEPTYRKIFGDG